MKKFKAFLSAACALLLCVSLAACGSKISPPMSAEETHKLCETYELKTRWLKSFTGQYYHPLKPIASNSHYNYPFCLFVVTGYEPLTIPESPDKKYYKISIQVIEVYSGDTAFTGKQVTLNRMMPDDSSLKSTVGQKYVGYFVDDEPYSIWTFLLTDDNLLVSPFGCQVEEGEYSNFSFANFSMECRSYTGKSVLDLVNDIKQYKN